MSENVTDYPIFADDDSYLGVCHKIKADGQEGGIRFEFKSRKTKIVSLDKLLSQAYNPALANQRRNKSK